jgi:hypothetical protein
MPSPVSAHAHARARSVTNMTTLCPSRPGRIPPLATPGHAPRARSSWPQLKSCFRLCAHSPFPHLSSRAGSESSRDEAAAASYTSVVRAATCAQLYMRATRACCCCGACCGSRTSAVSRASLPGVARHEGERAGDAVGDGAPQPLVHSACRGSEPPRLPDQPFTALPLARPTSSPSADGSASTSMSGGSTCGRVLWTVTLEPQATSDTTSVGGGATGRSTCGQQRCRVHGSRQILRAPAAPLYLGQRPLLWRPKLVMTRYLPTLGKPPTSFRSTGASIHPQPFTRDQGAAPTLTSGTPPTAVDTTSSPAAAASTSAMQKASVRLAFTNTWPRTWVARGAVGARAQWMGVRMCPTWDLGHWVTTRQQHVTSSVCALVPSFRASEGPTMKSLARSCGTEPSSRTRPDRPCSEMTCAASRGHAL